MSGDRQVYRSLEQPGLIRSACLAAASSKMRLDEDSDNRLSNDGYLTLGRRPCADSLQLCSL